MSTPDLFQTVGFEKSKIGTNETELGYAIKRTRLIGMVVGCFGLMGVLGGVIVWTQFEVRFEKRSFHQELRKEQHHAAAKLAKVGMKLWHQYEDDIRESHEASNLLEQIESNYETFKGELRGTVNDIAKDLNLHEAKAHHLADQVLHEVAEMQEKNLKVTKKLLDHLFAAGKRAEVLSREEKREVDEDIRKEEMEEQKDAENNDVQDFAKEDESDDELKNMITNFWYVFNDYKKEFLPKAKNLLKPGHEAWTQLEAIKKNITSESGPVMSEEEVGAALGKIDLAAVGVPMGEGRALPPQDIVSELLHIQSIPFEELNALEKEWNDSKIDSVNLMGKVEKMSNDNLIPGHWLLSTMDKMEDMDMGEDQEVEQKIKGLLVEKEGMTEEEASRVLTNPTDEDMKLVEKMQDELEKEEAEQEAKDGKKGGDKKKGKKDKKGKGAPIAVHSQ